MASELKTISDAIKPMLSDLGYRRKGNTFYRIVDRLVFCIMVEHPGLYYAEYHINPLYMPQDYVHLNYGKRFKVWWDGNGDITVFISQIKEGIYDEVIPFFQRIDSASRLLSFLQQDYSAVSSYFQSPHFRYSFLAAYTALMLHNSEVFHSAVSKTRQLLSETTSFARSVVEKIEAELTNLETIALLSEEEIDRHFQAQVLQNTKKPSRKAHG